MFKLNLKYSISWLICLLRCIKIELNWIGIERKWIELELNWKILNPIWIGIELNWKIPNPTWIGIELNWKKWIDPSPGCRQQFQMYFLQKKYFYLNLNFSEVCLRVKSTFYVSIGSGNLFLPDKQSNHLNWYLPRFRYHLVSLVCSVLNGLSELFWEGRQLMYLNHISVA